MEANLRNLLSDVVAIAKAAGELILSLVAGNNALQVMTKKDNSPVTSIDIAANHFIVEQLKLLDPEILIISEEADFECGYDESRKTVFWLVDPLDGTKGFIQGSNEYTVNIALVDNGIPVLGVIYAPALDQLYYACEGVNATLIKGGVKKSLHCRAQQFPWCILVSQFHDLSRLVSDSPEHVSVHSAGINSSLKFGLIASGGYDLYPRLGPTCLWDTAAGQIILECAGGAVVDLFGKRLQYHPESGLLNPEFIAVGDQNAIPAAIEFLLSRRKK